MPDNQPQFTTASYKPTDSVERCASCKSPLGATYYRVNGALACESCAKKVGGSAPKDSHTAFMRALLYGFGGALLGLAIYAFVGIVLSMQFGIVALAVGYIVARAMKIGSGGIGGTRYQIAAVLFTYFAVSVAAIPIYIAAYSKIQKAKHAAATQQHTLQDGSQSSADATPSTDHNPEADDSADGVPAQRPSHGITVGGIFMLIGIGLASPFLELWQTGPNFNTMIGLFILFIGMRIAWRMTGTTDRPTNVLGPFTQTAPAGAAPAAPPPPLG
jgi:hypothetical protein